MTARIKRELTRTPYQVFLVGLAIMLEHLLEDALVHKENGSSLAAQLGSSALTLAVVAAGAALYPFLRRLRPLLVAFFGLLALSGGWRAHVWDVLDGDAAGGDYSGAIYALAGIVLILLAVFLAVEVLRGRTATAST